MTVEDIYLKLRDELTADNESSSSPERIFIKNDEQTICTLGMNRSHEIIFVEFKPSPKDLPDIEREGFVHPHPVEMLHDAGWRQAQITVWEEAEKLLEIIHRSYKKKRVRPSEEGGPRKRGGKAGKGRGLKMKRGMAPAGIATRSPLPASAKEMRDRKGGKREASKEARHTKAAVKTAKPTATKKPAVRSAATSKVKAKTTAAKKKAKSPAKKKPSKKRR
jgi:hypothetical protein